MCSHSQYSNGSGAHKSLNVKHRINLQPHNAMISQTHQVVDHWEDRHGNVVKNRKPSYKYGDHAITKTVITKSAAANHYEWNVPKDGIAMLHSQIKGWVKYYLNGEPIGSCNGEYSSGDTVSFPVKKGDIIETRDSRGGQHTDITVYPY